MTVFSIRKPDDLHVHFRDDARTPVVVPHTAAQFARGIAMPNLVPPVTTVERAHEYRDYILDHVPAGCDFEPLMTLYLTEDTTVEDVKAASESPYIHAFKLYPAHATTNSAAGVHDLENVTHVLEAMQKYNVLLLMHGEVTAHDIDIFDREKVFVETKLQWIVDNFPELKLVSEHITTKEAAQFVESVDHPIAATITPQHLLSNRNHMLVGGIKPHYYCLPILKAEEHRKELVRVATSGSSRFFAGTDSAPHSQGKKECACGCAGCYSACNAVELYAEAFDLALDLTKPESQKIFEKFMSVNGAMHYGLSMLSQESITLEKKDFVIPTGFEMPDGEMLIPYKAGETLRWSVQKH